MLSISFAPGRVSYDGVLGQTKHDSVDLHVEKNIKNSMSLTLEPGLVGVGGPSTMWSG